MTERTPRLAAEDRRRQVVEATLRVVARDGFTGLTMDVIAREAGVTRTPLYAIFGNLETLLRAAADEGERRVWAAVPQQVFLADPGSQRPDEMLAEASRVFLEAVHADPVLWRVVLLPASSVPASIRIRYERNRATIIDGAEHLVRWVLEALGSPPGVDPHVVARMVIAVGEDLGRMMLAEPERWSPDRLSKAAGAIASLMPAERLEG